jgi:hypothetical protein
MNASHSNVPSLAAPSAARARHFRRVELAHRVGRAYRSPASVQQRLLDAVAEQRLEILSRRWDRGVAPCCPVWTATATFAQRRNAAPGELLASTIPDEIKAGDVLRLYLVYA